MPMLSYFCKYCIHWDYRFTRVGEGRFGNCEEPSVNAKVQKDEKSQVDVDDGAFYTNENFGCIYFRKTELVATKLPPTPGADDSE